MTRRGSLALPQCFVLSQLPLHVFLCSSNFLRHSASSKEERTGISGVGRGSPGEGEGGPRRGGERDGFKVFFRDGRREGSGFFFEGGEERGFRRERCSQRFHIEMRHRHHYHFGRLRNDLKGITSLMNHQVQHVMYDCACNAQDD